MFRLQLGPTKWSKVFWVCWVVLLAACDWEEEFPLASSDLELSSVSDSWLILFPDA